MRERLIVVDADILFQIAQNVEKIIEKIELSDPKKEYLDASEVKKMMKWSDSTFRRYCKTVAIHKVGGRVFIHHSDIENLLSRKSINPSPTSQDE